jgi:hypothetical protein
MCANILNLTLGIVCEHIKNSALAYLNAAFSPPFSKAMMSNFIIKMTYLLVKFLNLTYVSASSLSQ